MRFFGFLRSDLEEPLDFRFSIRYNGNGETDRVRFFSSVIIITARKEKEKKKDKLGTFFRVFVWAPSVVIAVFIAFEYNSLATRITQKRHMRAVAAESAALENAALASLGAMDVSAIASKADPEDSD